MLMAGVIAELGLGLLLNDLSLLAEQVENVLGRRVLYLQFLGGCLY